MWGNMGFNNFDGVATMWLENYSPNKFDGSSGDARPLFVVAIRKAVESLPSPPTEELGRLSRE